MCKLAVLCVVLASAVADPAAVITSLPYTGNVVLPAPAPALYGSQPSRLIYSSPVLSTSLPYPGYAHLIKKRSALGISSYIAPSTYVASSPLVSTYTAPITRSYVSPLATTYARPLAATYSSPLYTTAHLIKKRSAPFILPSTYVAPAAYSAAPFVASTYAAAGPIVATPVVSTAPIAYSHYIKKRSAPLAVAAFDAPSSYSHQSRFDYRVTSPAITYSSYSSPLVYSYPDSRLI